MLPKLKKGHEDDLAIQKAFARLFATDDGRRVLSHLQSLTFSRVMGMDSTDAQLRYMEGQRAVIATIQRYISQGKNP